MLSLWCLFFLWLFGENWGLPSGHLDLLEENPHESLVLWELCFSCFCISVRVWSNCALSWICCFFVYISLSSFDLKLLMVSTKFKDPSWLLSPLDSVFSIPNIHNFSRNLWFFQHCRHCGSHAYWQFRSQIKSNSLFWEVFMKNQKWFSSCWIFISILFSNYKISPNEFKS